MSKMMKHVAALKKLNEKKKALDKQIDETLKAICDEAQAPCCQPAKKPVAKKPAAKKAAPVAAKKKK